MDPRDILKHAMKLPTSARAALAASLMESLAADVEAGAAAEWSAEIERRIRDVDEGRVDLIPWDDVRRDLGR